MDGRLGQLPYRIVIQESVQLEKKYFEITAES